jgi:hypothetical protein
VNTVDARQLLEKVAERNPEIMRAVRLIKRENQLKLKLHRLKIQLSNVEIKTTRLIQDVVYEDAFKSPMQKGSRADDRLYNSLPKKKISIEVVNDDTYEVDLES